MAAPLGQRVPSLCGLRGSPSMFTILPLTVWIRVAHPTEQNGQMLGVVLASLIRNSCARAAAGASVTPSPTSPPIAVPAPALAVSCRKSRRLTCMESSPQVSRRDFLQLTASAGAGTAIGGLVGLGVTLAPAAARAQELRIKDAKTTPSICPFCSVGCATLIHTVNGKIVNNEGDPRSPHNEGTLCPKGAAIYQLHMNPNRATKVLHRKPGAGDWEVVELEWAMDRVAELIKKTRDETFIEKLPNGKLVNMTPAMFALGGATLDNEFNHVCQKFWRGLGVVAIENQARI